MSDFINAFKQGQNTARLAIEAKAEISEVLRSLATELLEATDGKLEIGVFESSNFLSAFAAIGKMASDFSGAPPAPGIARAKVIGARNVKAIQTQIVTLAKWERPHEGYPCQISFNGRAIACHDRQSLELALAEMLQDAWVGEQLRDLLELLPKSAAIKESDGTASGQPPE